MRDIISLYHLIGRHGWWFFFWFGLEKSAVVASWDGGHESQQHILVHVGFGDEKPKCFICFVVVLFKLHLCVRVWLGWVGWQLGDGVGVCVLAAITLLLIYVAVVYLIWFQCECKRYYSVHRYMERVAQIYLDGMPVRVQFIISTLYRFLSSNWKGFWRYTFH